MQSKTFKRKNVKSKNKNKKSKKSQKSLKRNSKRNYRSKQMRSNIRKMRGGANTQANIKEQIINIELKGIRYDITIPNNLLVYDQESVNHRGKGVANNEVYRGKWNNSNVAIKFIIKNKEEEQYIIDELDNFVLASKLNIGPQIYYKKCCETYEKEYKSYNSKLDKFIKKNKQITIGYIVMELVDNVYSYVKKMKAKHRLLDDILTKLHENLDRISDILINNNYIYTDINSGNFGFKGDNDLVLLDLASLTIGKHEDFRKYLDSSISEKIIELYNS